MTAQLTTSPNVSISDELLSRLYADDGLGPLIVDDLADGYSLRELAAPAIGWVADDEGSSIIYSADGEQAIPVRRNGEVRAFGFTTDAAVEMLKEVQRAFLAAALARDIEREDSLI